MALVPCAACKVLNHVCSDVCIFKTSFPSTEPEKFDRVDRIFGAENIFKFMANPNLNSWERDIVATALSYEAEARIQDPICGYVGIFLVFKNILNSLKEQIDSEKNELAAIVGPERVPQYSNIPMCDHFLTTQASLNIFIDGMEELNDEEKNQLKRLPIIEAHRIVDEIVYMRGNQDGRRSHGTAGASTSAGPSMALGSTSNTQQGAPLLQNQNQP